jgi:hypothetical protein
VLIIKKESIINKIYSYIIYFNTNKNIWNNRRKNATGNIKSLFVTAAKRDQAGAD